MCERSVSVERFQSSGEEIANSVSHGLGLIAILAATPFLIIHAVRQSDAAFITGASIFAATLILLYLCSTLYHALPRGRAKRVFQLIERVAIFLLIAGTYTPLTLGVLHGPWGWTLFGLVWAFAAAGIAIQLSGGHRFPILSTLLYLAMGWLMVIVIRPLWIRMPHVGFFWVLLGGLAYSLGVIFYSMDNRVRYSHFIWHLFVIAGSTFHFLAVLWYAA